MNRCPRCGLLFHRAASPAMPFCSQRCQQIDLLRWLKEDYRMPILRNEDEEGDEPPPPPDEE